jgi:hypothetical protein
MSPPPKFEFVRQNPSFYIESLRITKIDGSTTASDWLHGCDVKLNADLVAIIGNKGAAKAPSPTLSLCSATPSSVTIFSFSRKTAFAARRAIPPVSFEGN